MRLLPNTHSGKIDVENQSGQASEEVLKKTLSEGWDKAKKLYYKTEYNFTYTTNEEFSRAPPELKNLVVIGCTGAGKSTLLNRLAGLKKEWVEPKNEDDDWELEYKQEPLFKSEAATEGVTEFTAFANVNYFGDESRPFTIVDTPGHNDPEGINIDDENRGAARQKLDEQAADLYDKLKALGRVNLILVIHNDVQANRLDPATYEVLKKVNEMFAKVEGNVWDHVVVAYSKCDELGGGRFIGDDGIKKKKADMLKAIQSPERQLNCTVDLPILTLSGIESRDGKSEKSKDFERLWEMLQETPDLSTENLQEFEGLGHRIQKLLEDRDAARLTATAYRDFYEVSIQSAVLLLALLLPLRSSLDVLNPACYIGAGCLDHPGFVDEMIVFAIFAFVIGWKRFYYFLLVLWDKGLGFAVAKGAVTEEWAREKFQLETREPKDNDSESKKDK
jgi:GTP-binding protein EngB required for normal cell division